MSEEERISKKMIIFSMITLPIVLIGAMLFFISIINSIDNYCPGLQIISTQGIIAMFSTAIIGSESLLAYLLIKVRKEEKTK